MVQPHISALLRERASFDPQGTAFTFVDYEADWEGVAESLTWSQLYRRTSNLAAELTAHAVVGDRAIILAPQGLDYIVAFYGALEAGLVPVPLPVPLGGAHDERVGSVLADTSPSVIFTTSPFVEHVTEYAQAQPGETPAVIAVDSLNLDDRRAPATGSRREYSALAYLQYTSGSTRAPAGVMVSHENVLANFKQISADYFTDYGKVAPPDTTIVSWLPFYHDMGLIIGVILPVLSGLPAVLTSPMFFLQRPARWMQLLARNTHAFSAAPNFAFELAARKTTDEDLAGLDLSNVLSIINGSERVQPVTIKRFAERFARFGFPESAIRPSYGLAEATVYVATREPGQPPKVVSFASGELPDGRAVKCAPGSGTPLVSYGVPRSQLVRIVDPDAHTECPAGTVGEVWVHGDNVASEYWRNSERSESTFGGVLSDPSSGTPEGPWLRTGDLGFMMDDELFIIGRVKDLLIVYGRNHSPEDIEATIQQIAPGRCAAIAVPDDGIEKLVAIIEFKNGDGSQTADRLGEIKRGITSAISTTHGLGVMDLVLVPAGSIPITTSGKVRRAMCVEQYRRKQFVRLDA